VLFRDHADVLEMILAKSNDANVINFKLRSVLHVAVYEESLQCIPLLLKHSASVTAQVLIMCLRYILNNYCIVVVDSSAVRRIVINLSRQLFFPFPFFPSFLFPLFLSCFLSCLCVPH